MPGQRATIVMYHYVRELPLTRYPRIKGLLAPDFVGQIDYMQRFYRFISIEQCIDAIYNGTELPPNAALLTFDDGYLDHYTVAFPILAERGIAGAFFPPARAIANREILGVNKIHFVLASVPNAEVLLPEIYALLDELRPRFHFAANDALFAKLGHANRFDSAPTIFIKRLLQKGLEREARDTIVDRLFAKYVTADDKAFANELYMSPEQLKLMAKTGMYIGSHGCHHRWTGELSVADQIAEVDGSIAFLRDLGVPTDNWVMCYPHGSYNDTLIEVLRARGCKLGLSAKVDTAALTLANAFTLERFDTNDLPKRADAAYREPGAAS
jgi:peptidoglycan/xylan/chitin deacetylase (PgdA/CDA1 family)